TPSAPASPTGGASVAVVVDGTVVVTPAARSRAEPSSRTAPTTVAARARATRAARTPAAHPRFIVAVGRASAQRARALHEHAHDVREQLGVLGHGVLALRQHRDEEPADHALVERVGEALAGLVADRVVLGHRLGEQAGEAEAALEAVDDAAGRVRAEALGARGALLAAEGLGGEAQLLEPVHAELLHEGGDHAAGVVLGERLSVLRVELGHGSVHELLLGAGEVAGATSIVVAAGRGEHQQGRKGDGGQLAHGGRRYRAPGVRTPTPA